MIVPMNARAYESQLGEFHNTPIYFIFVSAFMTANKQLFSGGLTKLKFHMSPITLVWTPNLVLLLIV